METKKEIDLNLLSFLREQGLSDQVDKIEKSLGINLTAVESALAAFITQDQTCVELKAAVRQLCVCDDAVYIQGESGTGKELIAKALGANRPVGRFVAVNVAALPSELVESTLFGYTRGAYTGATLDKEGLIQYAGEGTLFLDEIGDLSFDLQAKFLRVLQDKKVRRVGALEEEQVKCRIVTASHFNLKELVAAGKFRLDLYARLSTFELQIPPLRNRLGDIPLIMNKLCAVFPCDKVDWTKVDLSLNVRSLEQYARRFTVLKSLPKISTNN